MRRGFTLMEVLIALAVLTLLGGSMLGFLWDLLDRRDALIRASVDGQAGSAALDRIEMDAVCAFAGDAGVGAGIAGTATSLRFLSRGVAIPLAAGETGAADLQRSEYSFDARAGVLRARRWTGSTGETELEVVSDRVQRMRVRYFDGRGWAPSFDSLAAGGLPVAIEVALWFGEPLAMAEQAAAGATPADAPELDAADAESEAGRSASGEAPPIPMREPDRVRLITIPDGPLTPWREAR